MTEITAEIILKDLVTELQNGTIKLGGHRSTLENLCKVLLLATEEDPTREGLLETPRRWAQWWTEFMYYDPGRIETVFEHVQVDQMVVVKGIPVWSLCEHHLLPFSSEISIGYITSGKVLGLSKVARIANLYAHRLQVQERLVSQIADSISALTLSPDVAVYAEGEHLCMLMRGIKSPGVMATSVMRGCFREEPSSRMEFLSIIKKEK